MSPSLNCSGLSAFPQHVSEFMGPAKSERHSTRSASSTVSRRSSTLPLPPADDSIPVKALPEGEGEGADKDQATVTASEPDAVTSGGTATEAGEGAAGTRSDAAIQPDR